MAEKDQITPIEWVDTESVADRRPLSPIYSSDETKDDAPESWYIKRFPIVVATKEWEVQRLLVRKSLLRSKSKKKSALIQIQIRRKSDQPLGIHGYRDVEGGSATSKWSDLIIDGDVIVFDILKPDVDEVKSRITGAPIRKKVSLPVRPESSESLSTLGLKGADDRYSNISPPLDPLVRKWSVKFSVPISKVTFKRDGSQCVATFGNMKNDSKESVSFGFASETEVNSFLQFVGELKTIHKNVATAALQKTFDSGVEISPFESNHFLIEIISATDLFPINRLYSDPFVVVSYGGERIHKTAVISRNVNPIWTIKTKSMFIFTLNPEELYHSDLIFEVRDFETFNASKSLGQGILTNEKLINSNGERIEIKLLKHAEMNADVQGCLAIRCKTATQEDIDFIKDPTIKQKRVRNNQSTYIQPLYSKQNPAFQLERSKMKDGQKHYFVRPMSSNKDERWMTKEQIEITSKGKSENWTEAGSGDLGELFVEIISCDNLPDLDGGLPRDKTDAFAALVFEDSVVTTDVIRDTLNPRFMPWTRRAFKFNITHGSSPLYIGVFDYDKATRFDSIGRISIPLQHFSPNTEYNLSYDLYNTTLVAKRKSRGVINLRLSVKWKGQRGLFFDAVKAPEQFTVNIDDKRNYDFVRYTVFGYEDPTKYNLKTLFNLGYELMEYQSVYYNILDGMKTVLLWRGHHPVSICCCEFKLPIHSFIFLGFGIVITEFPKYSMSVFFASITWFMLALLGNRVQRPLLWDRPPFFNQLLLRFLTGGRRPVEIAPNQNKEEDTIFMEKEMARVENNKREAEKYLQAFSDDLAELDEAKNKIMFKDSGKTNAISLGLFKNQLQPVQTQLHNVLYIFRLIDRILSWDQM